MGDNEKIRVVELFAGIGAQAMALEVADIPHECVAVCEIDEKAYCSYCAIHGDTPNLGDINKVDHLPECDLLTYSFPCQDLSNAGKRRGMVEGSGTRSSLLWEVGRLLEDMRERETLPEVLVMENVDAILYEKNMPQFRKWLSTLIGLGYHSEYKVLNASDYNIPQNRKRCFAVSILGNRSFEFPKPIPSTRRLKDILEPDVAEEYYLSEDRLKTLTYHKERNAAAGRGFGFEVLNPDNEISKSITTRMREENCTLILAATWDGFECASRAYNPDGICPTVTAHTENNPKILIANSTKIGYLTAVDGDGIDLEQRKGRRGRVQQGRVNAIKCSDTIGTYTGGRVRKLTPRECWRAMDFPDYAYDRAVAVGTTKTQLYKQAGNSICVGVLVAIFKQIYATDKRVFMPTLNAYIKAEDSTVKGD